MKLKIVQLKVEKDIRLNKTKIIGALDGAEKDQWVIFPEAMLSGYYPNEANYTSGLDWPYISDSLTEIRRLAIKRECHCVLGSATKMNEAWHNTLLVFSYRLNEGSGHHKIQLSAPDKNHFEPGEDVKVYEVNSIKFGLQACRELLFPSQWAKLKSDGAKIVFHINNAIQPHDSIWKHILISRAIENSIFVVSVNNAESPQKLSSYIISPNGEILAETQTQKEAFISYTIDLNQVIEDLSQRKDF
jgi:predicted amidohydrolase